MLTDTHCHLDYNKFDSDRAEVIQRANDSGLIRMLVPGLQHRSSSKALRLAESNPRVYAAVGFHPTDLEEFSEQTFEEVKKLAADWLPVRALAGHAGSALMLGHVTLEALDPLRAASHSPAVVGLLRSDWGYNGALITDDINMGAVYKFGIGKVATEALAAGVDLVLVSYDPRQFYRALYCAAVALRNGRLMSDDLAARSQRLARLTGHQQRAR